VKVCDGPIALALWPETFRRDPAHWVETDLALFQNPPREGAPLPPEKAVAVVQAWDKQPVAVEALLDRLKRLPCGWVLALDRIDQTWEPRVVPIPR
jgi:hypothetical protein